MKKTLLILLCFAMILPTVLLSCDEIGIGNSSEAGAETTAELEDEQNNETVETSFRETDFEFTDSTTVTETQPETEPQPTATELFTDYVNSGDYIKAIECYKTQVYGNVIFESEAQNCIVSLCEDVVNGLYSGNVTLEEATIKFKIVQNINSEVTIITNDKLESYLTDAEEALESKAAYSAALEFFTLQNYKDAIALFEEVVRKDTNYNDAQAKIGECKTAYKNEQMTIAISYAEKSDYIKAIQTLEELAKLVKNDSEISSKITVYEKTYINDQIAKAEKVFVEPAKDYEKALKYINTALKYYPSNADLNAKMQYYSQFEPVNLYDLNAYTSKDWYKHDSQTSNTGIKYYNCMGGTTAFFTGDPTASFYLDNEYDIFSCTIFTTSVQTYGEVDIVIYGDGKVIYSITKEAAFIPFDITLDVSGINILKIEFKNTQRTNMANAILQKNEK